MSSTRIPADSEPSIIERVLMILIAVIVVAVLGIRIVHSGLKAHREAQSAEAPPSTPTDPTRVDNAWRKRLASNPTDFAALLALAVELETAGRQDEARAALDQSLRMAPTNGAVLRVAADFALRHGDEATALELLRRYITLHPHEAGKAWPVLTQAMASGRHRGWFERIAKSDPPWWPEFFRNVCQSAVPFGGAQLIFEARLRASLATADERRCAISRLQREGKWPVAWMLWINGLAQEQRKRVGFIYNGDFEQTMSNLGFDWIVSDQDSVVTSTEWTEGVNERRALHVTFVNKRYAGPPIHQYLMLHPGRYRFEGRSRVDGLNVWLGLQWALYCPASPPAAERQLTHTETFTGSSDWTAFRQEFAVGKDCPVQILRLELANPRQDVKAAGNVAIRLRGGIWFDDLKVRIVD